jgi:hypothetical protein
LAFIGHSRILLLTAKTKNPSILFCYDKRKQCKKNMTIPNSFCLTSETLGSPWIIGFPISLVDSSLPNLPVGKFWKSLTLQEQYLALWKCKRLVQIFLLQSYATCTQGRHKNFHCNQKICCSRGTFSSTPVYQSIFALL